MHYSRTKLEWIENYHHLRCCRFLL